jgi:hypothetical protein
MYREWVTIVTSQAKNITELIEEDEKAEYQRIKMKNRKVNIF